MKVVTLLGIRPDIIRMFKLIELLDAGQEEHGYKHVFGHTGQHYDAELDQVFYDELGVRAPDFNLSVGLELKSRGGGSASHQMALLFERTQEMLDREKPDLVLYLGDTNTVTSALVVSRNNIPVVHVEAGGRSYDWRMPEEKNRIVIDHLSDALYCYHPRHVDILHHEGIPEFRTHLIGNIIYDAIERFLPKADKSDILSRLNLKSQGFYLCTLHREENVVNKDILTEHVRSLIELADQKPVLWPVMPRTKKQLEEFGLWSRIVESKILITKPLGYFDFLKLEKEAELIISDSGTVQEEALILGVPAVVIRESTERPETIFARATVMDSSKPLLENAKRALDLPRDWDRNALNVTSKSPSENVYNDLIKKIEEGYFQKNRQAMMFEEPFYQESRGKQYEV